MSEGEPPELDNGALDAAEDASGGNEASTDRKSSAGRGFGDLAWMNLRRARKTMLANEWQQDGRSEFLLAEASILATLDLAAAVRGSREPT